MAFLSINRGSLEIICVQSLKHLLFYAAGEPMAGIQYRPESLQGMRENLERVLQFMSSKQIKMHNISSRYTFSSFSTFYKFFKRIENNLCF